jgi:2-haloacid dehalogenase
MSTNQNGRQGATEATGRIDAVAFDAYGTLFDVYSVGSLAEQLFPGKGAELALLWRERQLDYTWLRTLSDRYKPFSAVTRDALRYSCRRLGLELDTQREARLMNQYACLSPFPENVEALKALKSMGVPLAILSNGDPEILAVSVRSAGMEGLFDHLLSVDAVRKFKTSAEAYSLGPAAFGVPASRILFVSSNGWDAIGATWHGYTAFWINRAGLPDEELDTRPAATGRLLTDVVRYVDDHRRSVPNPIS